MYEERRFSNKTSIIVTEIGTNGFFYAQFEEELVIIRD